MKGRRVDEYGVGRPDQDTRCERVVSQSVGPDGLSFRSGRLEDCGTGFRHVLSSSSFCLVVIREKRSGRTVGA